MRSWRWQLIILTGSAIVRARWTPSLTVDDLDDMVRRLRGQGVQFDAEEEGADEGYRLVRVRDPEGNPIGLTA